MGMGKEWIVYIVELLKFKIMSELYWLSVLGNIHLLCEFVALISGFGVVILVMIFKFDIENVENPLTLKKLIKCSAFTLAFAAIMCAFIPSKKSLLVIYGVGGTIDYLKENKVANKIPDKCVKVIDMYLDDVLNDDLLKDDKDKE